MSIKVAQNDFPGKIKDFATFAKLPKNVGKLGKTIVATVAPIPINRPIWSHCPALSLCTEKCKSFMSLK